MKNYSYDEISKFQVKVREAELNMEPGTGEHSMLQYYEGQMSIIKILLHHMLELDGDAESVTETLKTFADITEKNILDIIK